MTPWFTMPADGETRRDAVRTDVAGGVSAIRCALALMDDGSLSSADRALLQAIDRELDRLARVVRDIGEVGARDAYVP